MGQCSTLPDDGNRNQAGADGGKHMPQSMNQSKHRSYCQSNTSSNSKKQPREGRDTSYYGRPGDDDSHRHNDPDVVMNDGVNMVTKNGMKHLNISEGNMQSKSKHAMQSPQYASGPPKSGRRSKLHVCPTAEENIPLPPESALRTRCYRLNLDAPVLLSPTHDHLGPFPYDPPAHHLPTRGFGKVLNHVSRSDESVESVSKSATQIAINTARIFRGITTDKNGVILSQNARASRSKNGKDRSKQADKSRQGNKIEKAMDIVDEDGGGSGKENDAEKSNMASLIVVGEYDDMKQLVRDGAKKLRDNENHPDENLMSLNRSRYLLQANSGIVNEQFSSSMNAQSRKRLPSPMAVHNSVETPTRSRSRSRVSQMPLIATPPKLKGHPRDRGSSRRNPSVAGSGNEEKSRCNDISLFGGGDSDWSEALDFSKGFNSIWNCGGTGNNGGGTSPINSPSPNQNGVPKGSSSKARYEGRNETSARFSRGGGVPTERDAPGVIL